jgi:hypothetical protein
VKGKVFRKMMLDLWASKAMLQPDEEKQVVMKTSLRELILYWSVSRVSYLILLRGIHSHATLTQRTCNVHYVQRIVYETVTKPDPNTYSM